MQTILDILNSPLGGVIGAIVAAAAGGTWLNAKYLPLINLVKSLLGAIKGKSKLSAAEAAVRLSAIEAGKWLSTYGRKRHADWEKKREPLIEMLSKQISEGLIEGLDKDD